MPHTEQWDWWVMRTGRPISTHLPHLPLPPFVYDVAQDTVAPGHNMYFLFQSLWPLNSADCHTGHESPESLKLLTDPQMACRLLRKLPWWGIGKPSSRVWGIESGQQSILRQNSRSTTHPQWGRSLSWLVSLAWEGGKVVTSSHLGCWFP